MINKGALKKKALSWERAVFFRIKHYGNKNL